MTEESRELKQEEMAKVAGGKVKDNGSKYEYQTTKPYCRDCKMQIPMVGRYYICDTIGCKSMSKPKTAKEVDWH